jgi:tetraacyldisaccharide 4'-kinase
MGATERNSYKNRIAEFTSAKTIFSMIQYGEPISVLENGIHVKPKAIVVSGIANDSLFVQECERRFEVVEKINYKDHHEYKVSEVKHIIGLVASHKDCMVITTEKDAVKLKKPSFHDYLVEIPIFALPIKIKMTEKDQKYLLSQISNMIAEKAYRL